MKRIATIASLCALLVGVGHAGAQTLGFGVHAGLSSPTGVYGDGAGPDAGGAQLGYAAGLDAWLPLGQVAPWLEWYTSVEVAAHGVRSQGVTGRTGSAVEGGYLYVPILTGVRVDVPVGPAAVFLTGQAGLVLTRGPSEFYPYGVGGADSKLGTGFGFGVGGGLQLTDRVAAGAKYYPLGDREFEYDDASDPMDQEVSYFDVYLGFGVR